MTADELEKKTSPGTVTTIHALPDAGKSTFMITVAEKMKTLFFDAEKKYGKICKNAPGYEKYKHNISGVTVSTLEDVINILQTKDISSFDAFVFDSVTAMVTNQNHNIMFTQKRKRTYDDYQDLGTKFFAIIKLLQERGASVFFTIQSKFENGMYIPDADGGNLVQKNAVRYSDWEFYLEKDGKNRVLHLRNSFIAETKEKGLPKDYPETIENDDIRFSSLWDIFPSKTAKKDMEKERVEKEEAAKKEADRMAKEVIKKKTEDIKTYNKSLKGCETVLALSNVWKVISTNKLNHEPKLVKIKDEMKAKLTPKKNLPQSDIVGESQERSNV